MPFVADIHLHSRWSRATSRDLTPENLHLWSMRKGIGVVGTADFTHPEWLAELRTKLVPADEGLYRLDPDLLDAVEEGVAPSCRRDVRFLLTVEISSIYKRGGRTRKIHNVVCLPSFEHVDELNRRLGAIGNLKWDGRPILGLDSRDLLEICLDVCPEVLFIPAHIWTPHFAVLGASSGFDSLEECFDDMLPYIFAVETGLSSDPPMNSRLSMLDRFAVVSNSDAHSPAKLGREATCFDTEVSYPAIYDALKTRDPERFTGTIEFYPEEGKYHHDGHRKCGISWRPPQTQAADGLCPECGKALTVGVLHRVEALADRDEDELTPVERPFEYLIPLDEVISSCVGVGPKSKRVQGIYHDMLQNLGPELEILRHVSPSRIAEYGQPMIAEGIRRMRCGEVTVAAGFDGEYGVIEVFTEKERKDLEGQSKLFDLSAHTVASAVSTDAVDRADVDAADVVQHMARTDSGRVDRLLDAAIDIAADGLDDAQRLAVHSLGAPVAVIAGPGAGKTRTLTHRIAWLIDEQHVAPRDIAAVTFTQRAARQMRQRLQSLLGDRADDISVGTFHRLALALLSECGDTSVLLDAAEALGLLRDVIAAFPSANAQTAEAQRRISRWKADGLKPFEVADDPLSAVYAGYQERLRTCGACDFDDLLLALRNRLRAGDVRTFSHVLVDEFQDVNAVQYELVNHLAGDGSGLFVIGDPDQAIYSFRGADPIYFERLQTDRDDLNVIRLAGNYRSQPAIVAAAAAVISATPDREGESWSALRDEQPVPIQCLQGTDASGEAQAVATAINDIVGGSDMQQADERSGTDVGAWALSDIAAVCRTTAQMELLEGELQQSNLPCRIVGQKDFVHQRGARDAVAFFRYALEPDRPLRLTEALRTGPFDIGAEALQKLAVATGAANPLDDVIQTLPTAAAAQIEALRRAAEGYLRRADTDGPAQMLNAWQADLGIEATPAFEQLVSVAQGCATLRQLLDLLLLGEDGDIERRSAAVGRPTSESITLLTMHAAKGLEFPVVFVCGVEDGLLPLRRPDGTRSDVEEERRLFYVALTRGMDRVVVTHAAQRHIHGVAQKRRPSPFLGDIPSHLLQEHTVAKRRKGKQMSLFP